MGKAVLAEAAEAPVAVSAGLGLCSNRGGRETTPARWRTRRWRTRLGARGERTADQRSAGPAARVLVGTSLVLTFEPVKGGGGRQPRRHRRNKKVIPNWLGARRACWRAKMVFSEALR